MLSRNLPPYCASSANLTTSLGRQAGMQSSSSSSQFSDCSSLLQGLLSIQLELFSLRCDVFGDCHWLGIAAAQFVVLGGSLAAKELCGGMAG